MVSLRFFILCGLLVYASLLLADLDSTDAYLQAQEWQQKAFDARLEGDLATQIEAFTEAARLFEVTGRHADARAALVERADAYLASGRYSAAIGELRRLFELERDAGDKARMAAIKARLGNAYYVAEELDRARITLFVAVALARDAGNRAVLAGALNNLASFLAAQKSIRPCPDPPRARPQPQGRTSALWCGSPLGRAYALQAMRIARETNDTGIIVKTMINAARVESAMGDDEKAQDLLARALETTETLADSSEKAFILINIGLLLQEDLHTAGAVRPESTLPYKAFSNALRVAEANSNARAASYAAGHLGEIYEQAKRYDKALDFTVDAILYAQQINASELLYPWHWQRGRLYKTQGELDSAIAAYNMSSFHLQRIRSELIAMTRRGGAAFRKRVGPFYLDLAELWLQRAAATDDQEKIATYLRDARQAVEELKSAELQEYFLDECLTTTQFKPKELERLAERAVIIYPILLSDRIELLLSRAKGIRRYTLPVTARDVTSVVREFRKNLENHRTSAYIENAERLYKWFIQPLEKELDRQEFDTLVIVPDGPLRTIPMAALYDGERYLIEKYALATTPGLTLTDPTPLAFEEVKALLAGLSEKVPGFDILPEVNKELAEIQRIIGEQNITLLENEDFVLENLEEALTGRPYDLVHIASHAQFKGSNLESFMVSHEGEQITIRQLEDLMQIRRFSDQPVELLTLSACQTAAGDDRAALGLSGIAIKAGARSALGSLWPTRDKVTAKLIVEFYDQLQDPSVSKAKALQMAQIYMLKETMYRHPAFWAPFLLIGNWL